MGKINVPDHDARVADVAERVAREDALKRHDDAIRYQAAYVKELLGDVDYPNFDVDTTIEAWYEWEKHKTESIMGFRDNSYKSAMTGAMAPHLHTLWKDNFDDSIESYLSG